MQASEKSYMLSSLHPGLGHGHRGDKNHLSTIHATDLVQKRLVETMEIVASLPDCSIALVKVTELQSEHIISSKVTDGFI